MPEKVHICNVRREQGFLYFIDRGGNVAKCRQGSSHQEIVCPNGGHFAKEPGWMYYLDRDGDVSRAKLKSFREFAEARDNGLLLV